MTAAACPTIGRGPKLLKISLSATSVSANNGTVTVSKAQGPTGTPAWSWVRKSGSTNVLVSGATTATATFSNATSGTWSAVFTCTATLGGQAVVSADVTVTITTTAPLGGSISGNASGTANAHSTTSITTNGITASGSGGMPGYTYSWSIAGSGITINNPSSATTSFTANVGTNSTVTGTATCTITDASFNTVTRTASVILQNTGYPTLNGSASPTSVSGTVVSSSSTTVTSGSTSVTPSGGNGSNSFHWTISGSFTANSPNSAATTFSQALGPGGSSSGTATCTITSGDGQTKTVTVSVSLTNTGSSYTAVSATVNIDSAFGTGASGAGGASTTPATVVTGHNGTGSYSFSWTRISGSTLISVNSPSSGTTVFTSAGQTNNTVIDATFRCTVSDGTTSDHVDVPVEITVGSPP